MLSALPGFGCHTVTSLLVALGGENGIGVLGLCRASVGRFSRVRAHEGASAADTLVAGAGREPLVAAGPEERRTSGRCVAP